MVVRSSFKGDVIALNNRLASGDENSVVGDKYKTNAGFDIRHDFGNDKLITEAYNRTDVGNKLATVNDESITGISNLIHVRLNMGWMLMFSMT